jgi:hypothetical protein
MYPLFDPPVNEFSTPDEIRVWISELEDLRRQPAYKDTTARRELDHTLAQAREFLEASLDLQARLAAERRVSGHRA